MKKIKIINGVNLNMLGIREKGVYGTLDYKGLCDYIADKCKDIDVQLEFYQSNNEGEIALFSILYFFREHFYRKKAFRRENSEILREIYI